MESENVKRLRRGYEAFSRGDYDTALAWMHPEIEWHRGGASIEGGVVRGREAVKDFLRPEVFDRQVAEVEEILDYGDQLLATVLFHARGKASGIEIASRGYHLWTLENGLVVRTEMFQEREEALAAVTSKVAPTRAEFRG